MLLFIPKTVCLDKQVIENCNRELTAHLTDGSMRKIIYNLNIKTLYLFPSH